MRDYTQHLAMNCGAVAAIFAVYGPNQPVPRVMDEQLSRQRLPAMQVAVIINRADAKGIQAKLYDAGSKVPIRDYSGPAATRPEPVEFLEALSDASFIEGVRDILTANRARCAIISGQNERGFHWQTYYIPVSGDRVQVYNGRKGWAPVIGGAPLGTPTGLILVSGPRMER
jgi:hypothetical protein